LVFATGNCPDPALARANGVNVVSEAAWAINAKDGTFKWVFSQGDTVAGVTYGGDTDIGPTPMVSPVLNDGDTTVFVPTKAGYIFALNASKLVTPTPPGANPKPVEVWETQAAQPGQTGPAFAGAIGGFIGSGAVGRAGTDSGAAKTIYAASAIWLPVKGEGASSDGGPQPDDTMASDPARASSLHAVDATTGAIKWHQPLATPTYAPVTYANGLVFAPATTSFAAAAYDAATGVQLWRAPAGGAPSSGVAVVGGDVFFGAGTSESAAAPTAVPPQPCGIWGYGLPVPALP
jgi:outer membrane protein assembly factor BamB